MSGRKALFVNRSLTTHVPQLKRHGSEALLEFLYRHIERPDHQCRFRWEDNSIAVWDNRSAQYYAVWDNHPQSRYVIM